MSEAQIQSEILQALKRIGIQAMRVNSGKVKVAGGWMQLAPEGTVDILVFPRMKLPIWIEVKTKAGRVSEAQMDFQATVAHLGHGYFVVRGIDDLMPLLKGMR